MFKKLDSKSNVLTESTRKLDFWKNLSIKPNSHSPVDFHPNISQVHSKENIPPEVKKHSSPYNSYLPQRGSETHRAQSSNSREDLALDKHLETIEFKLSEINKLKTQLQNSYRDKKDELRLRERELISNEQEFKKKYIAFEEERSKWCNYISMKLKDVKNKEAEVDVEKRNCSEQMERSKKIEEAFYKLQGELKEKGRRLMETEDILEKREENLDCNEERLNMKMEDIACYEFRIVEYEAVLMERDEELERTSRIIQEKKEDIDKTTEMFEKIHEQLQLESKRATIQAGINNSRQIFLKKDEAKLRIFERNLMCLKADLELREKQIEEKVYHGNSATNYTLKEIYDSDSIIFSESSEDFESPEYNVRTPE